MAVDVVVMSVFMVAVEGTSVLVVPMSGAMVSVTSSVDVSETLAVIVVVSKLFPAVEEGRSSWLVTIVVATVDSGLDVSVLIMVVVGAGVSVLSMAVAVCIGEVQQCCGSPQGGLCPECDLRLCV